MCSLYLFLPLTVSVEECSEYMLYNMLRPEHKTGAHFVTNTGDEAKKSRYFANEDVSAKVWQHSVEVTGLESNK